MLAWLQSKSSLQDAHNTLTFEKPISNKISLFFLPLLEFQLSLLFCVDYIVTCNLHYGTFWFHCIDMPKENGEKRDYCWKSVLTHSFRRHVNTSVGC